MNRRLGGRDRPINIRATNSHRSLQDLALASL